MAVLLEQQSGIFSLRVGFAEDGRIRMFWLDRMNQELRDAILRTRPAESLCSVFLVAGEPGFRSERAELLGANQPTEGDWVTLSRLRSR